MENLFCVLGLKLYMACVAMLVLTTIIVHPHKTIDKELPRMMHHIYTFGNSIYDANKHESKPKTKQKTTHKTMCKRKLAYTKNYKTSVNVCFGISNH